MVERQTPVFIVTAGRCGSTLLSNLLSRHPDILSLSEVFMAVNTHAFVYNRLDGEAFWRLLSTPRRAMSETLTPATCPHEFMYDFSRSRLFTQKTLPPILYMMLPPLSPEPDVLFFELEAAITSRPKAALSEQYEFMFSWLCQRLGKKIWIERSGASLLFVPALARLYPNAKFIHLFRDGRDVALSMQSYPPLRLLAQSWRSAKRFGVDLLEPPFRIGESRIISVAERFLSPIYGAGDKLHRTSTAAEIGEFWSAMTLLGLRHLDKIPDEQKLSVSYEGLVRTPRQSLRQLIDFVGPLDGTAEWLEDACNAFQPGKGRKRALDGPELDALTRACEPGLTALGYHIGEARIPETAA